MTAPDKTPIAKGRGTVDGAPIAFDVIATARYSLEVTFPGAVPARIEAVEIEREGLVHPIGDCRCIAKVGGRQGLGHLFGSKDVLDYSRLTRANHVRTTAKDFHQLPLLLKQGEQIRREFKTFCGDLIYAFQTQRKVLDDIDRALDLEPVAVAESVRERMIEERAPAFNAFFDDWLTKLEHVTSSFSKLDHERHGYYFRRQTWDLITKSAFMYRTNVRPRGYAGDSAMMRWIYEREYVGTWMFDRLMHRHPIECPAAQAVRNRRTFIPQELQRVRARFRSQGRTDQIRFMSVACGPAWELRDLFDSPADVEEFAGLLLDQDDEALGEARHAMHEAKTRLGVYPNVEFARESVRTMLRTKDLTSLWGEFDFVYSMGLFDYLNRPVAMAVLRKIYGLLRPGGQLVVGNYHLESPSRIYMDYWMDWSLLYREEQEMLDMAACLPGAEADVQFDETRSQMFLRIRREA